MFKVTVRTALLLVRPPTRAASLWVRQPGWVSHLKKAANAAFVMSGGGKGVCAAARSAVKTIDNRFQRKGPEALAEGHSPRRNRE